METLEYDAGTCKNNFNEISFKKLRKNKTIQTIFKRQTFKLSFWR